MNSFLKFLMSKDGIVTILTLVLLATVAHFNTERPWVNFAARVGNLCVFLYILWRAFGRQVVTALADRRTSIANDLESMTARRDEAEKQLAELEQRLSGLESECEAIIAESRVQAEAIKTSILERAEKEAATIIESAKRSAASRSRSELAALRSELADELRKVVEDSLRRNLTKEQQNILIDNSLKKVAL